METIYEVGKRPGSAIATFHSAGRLFSRSGLYGELYEVEKRAKRCGGNFLQCCVDFFTQGIYFSAFGLVSLSELEKIKKR